jgi:hypothetical protein
VPGLPADNRVSGRAAPGGQGGPGRPGGPAGPLTDPVAEARRLIAAAEQAGVVLRALGGVAFVLQAPGGASAMRPPRQVKDIDLAVPRGAGRNAAQVIARSGYVADEMFNALRGHRRLLFVDPESGRHVDVFVGEFSMCHDIPLTERLDRDPLTVPREELLLTKLQIVRRTANDLNDIYGLLLHHEVGSDADAPISAPFIGALCARDWGLWRTCGLAIEASLAHLPASVLDEAERAVVAARLGRLTAALDAEPKSRRWRMRAAVGDRVRWYAEPEEEQGEHDGAG